ncbi:hypothetical protein FQP87_22340 [Vibrio tasmaniensis]|nr:hypothetical protein FQP87_22340 [Vibrio tasmaniensis]
MVAIDNIMKHALFVSILFASTVNAMTQQQMQDKQNYLQQVKLVSPTQHTAINLADQVIMFDCGKTMLLQDLKGLVNQKEFNVLWGKIQERNGIIGFTEARNLLTNNGTSELCK